MSIITTVIMASFTRPEQIGTNPQSLLWLLPLAAAIVIVYKATKMSKITPAAFIKEAATLFGSIIVFIIIIAAALYGLGWLITE